MPLDAESIINNTLDTVTKYIQKKTDPSSSVDSDATATVTMSIVFDLICPWLIECDRAESTQHKSNDMHAMGLGIAAVLYLYDIAIPSYSQSPSSLFSSNQAINAMNMRDLQVFIGNLQVQFMSLYQRDSNGIRASVDITCLLLHVMKRMGFWTCNEFESDSIDPHLKELASVHGNYLQIRFEEVESLLDVIHTMLGTHRLLCSAKSIWASSDIELFHHHREASTETWWEISIITDCPIGSIIQYKNKFKSLFHSVSQVVYFHYPTYSRQRQLPLSEIQNPRNPTEDVSEDTAKATKHLLDCHINVLPLIMQVEPGVAVLYEHTGAGHRPTMANNAWNWIVLGRFVLLADQNMNVYVADDLRSLVSFMKADGRTMA
jgi:hypothetical protein